jgi:hypothetical protein
MIDQNPSQTVPHIGRLAFDILTVEKGSKHPMNASRLYSIESKKFRIHRTLRSATLSVDIHLEST